MQAVPESSDFDPTCSDPSLASTRDSLENVIIFQEKYAKFFVTMMFMFMFMFMLVNFLSQGCKSRH